MVAGDLTAAFSARAALTITLASLATGAATGRQSTIVTGNTYPVIHVWCKVTVGTSPTANTRIYVWLIKSNGTERSDAAGASDASLPIVNSRLLGVIRVPVTTSDTPYYGEFTIYNPGPEWGIAISHDTAVNLNSTGGNHAVTWEGEYAQSAP